MSRRPYVCPMKRTWFLDHPFYRKYMVRESSSIFGALYAINLFIGLLQLKAGAVSWQSWLDFQARPLMICFTLLTLAFTLYHSITFIAMCPRVMPQQIRILIADKVIVVASYAVFIGVSMVILLAAVWGVCV